MKKSKKQNKKKIFIFSIIISIIIIIVGAIIIFTLPNKDSKTEEEKQLEKTIELLGFETGISPYTLDEIYAIVEDPKLYYKENDSWHSIFGTNIYFFYEYYFSKTTPFKVATKVRKENNKIVEVLEVDYIDYSEFEKRTEQYRQYVNTEKISTEESNKKYNTNIDYRIDLPCGLWINEIIYGYAEVVE